MLCVALDVCGSACQHLSVSVNLSRFQVGCSERTFRRKGFWNLRATLLDTGGFPGGLDGKESACNAGDLGSILGSGRSPGEGNGYPLQYSYLENFMDRGAWWAVVYGVTKSQTRLSN